MIFGSALRLPRRTSRSPARAAGARNRPIRARYPGRDTAAGSVANRPRALPVPGTRSARRSAPTAAPAVDSSHAEPRRKSPEQRQLNYANGLFGRKLYDLAIPEYEKFLGLYPKSPDRATAFFYLGEAYRALNRIAAARTSFQSVLRRLSATSELAGPASYGARGDSLQRKRLRLGACRFSIAPPRKSKAAGAGAFGALFRSALSGESRSQRRSARPLSAGRSTRQESESVSRRFAPGGRLDLSRARTKERCSEAIRSARERDEQAGAQSRSNCARRLGRARSRSGGKRKTRQGDDGRKRPPFCKKAAPCRKRDAGAGSRRSDCSGSNISPGNTRRRLTDYKQSKDQVPEEARPEMMLLAGQQPAAARPRQGSAGALSRRSSSEYPSREEAKDAQYQRLISTLQRERSDAARRDRRIPQGQSERRTRRPGEAAQSGSALQREGFCRRRAALRPICATSKLSPKLRAEAAFKLGWCFVQIKRCR